MGLTTWKNAPGGAICKADVGIAKNYLAKDEIEALDRVVTMYLYYAEDQARGKRPMHVADWVKKLDAFLQFTARNILTHAGKVSKEMAQTHAEREFEKFEAARRLHEATEPTSDFDKAVEEVKRLEKNKTAPPLSPEKPRKKPGKKKGGDK